MTNNLGKEFTSRFVTKIQGDIAAVSSVVLTAADRIVIDDNFASHFPKNKLTEGYKRRKIKAGYPEWPGERTGKLRAAATKLTNWKSDKRTKEQFIATKKRTGLTAYSRHLRTKTGGYIDFLNSTSDQLAALNSEILNRLGSDYKQTGQLELQQ